MRDISDSRPFSCFKAYDVRGKVPGELNPAICGAIGGALVQLYAPAAIAMGHDARRSSPALVEALTRSLLEHGVKVVSLGLCGTEEVYYAAATGDFDLGIMITGSHNPIDENGIKFVRRGAVPISSDSGLLAIASLASTLLTEPHEKGNKPGSFEQTSMRRSYIDTLLSFSGIRQLAGSVSSRPRILVDAGNGCAGPVLQALAPSLPAELILMNAEPDGNFPGGIPNPLMPDKRAATVAAIISNKADLGIAFDGDFDRCFFYDHNGRFIDSCYLAGLLAAEILNSHPGEKIVHDIRVYWNIQRIIALSGGVPIKCKAGHSHIKEKMRQENAIFGAELSGHYFYRDFAFCDSGMLTMLLVLSLLTRTGRSLADLVDESFNSHPCSGEINFKVRDAQGRIAAVREKYTRGSVYSDELDGINLEFPQWRFNLRSSNTEPLLRLNIESRSNPELLREKLAELTSLIMDD